MELTLQERSTLLLDLPQAVQTADVGEELLLRTFFLLITCSTEHSENLKTCNDDVRVFYRI